MTGNFSPVDKLSTKLIRSCNSCLFNIGSTDSAYSDVIYSIYIYGHTRTHTVYYDRLCDASNASVYNMCTKFVIMKRFNFVLFFFFSDSCLCVSDRIPQVSRKDNACSRLFFFLFVFGFPFLFSFIGTC